ncbi:MAG: hypothetical protein H7276_06305 [Caulobacter sp.]|nr:hypothetical protein [Vitreoscilla sp.]
MLATVLGSITSRHRAWAFALLWLLALTILNVQTGGACRSTFLFAIPVAVVSWSDVRLGFLFAALAVVAARFGGALPEPASSSPLWLDAMLAFVKLSIDAVVVNAWGRHRRRRAGAKAAAEGIPLHDAGSHDRQQKEPR